MTIKDFYKDIEGYTEIQKEIEVLRKHSRDYSSEVDAVAQIISLLHPNKIELIVSKISNENENAKTFRLSPTNNYLPPFQAGQYINLFVNTGGILTSRPYSITSPPNQTGYYDITVKRVEDGFVSSFLMDNVKTGNTFESTSPSGNFYYNPLVHGTDLVFLAGGSGITPLMSMIREAVDKRFERNIHLVYGNQIPEDIIFSDKQEKIGTQCDNIKISHVISDPPDGYEGLTGFISADLMANLIDDIQGKTFFLCGPEAMYSYCMEELHTLGVKKKKIRKEVYGPPKDVTSQPGWPNDISANDQFTVKIMDGKKISAAADEPLMNSLERAGIVIPASCRSGECSLCRTKLISGRIFHPQGVRLRKSDRQFGFIHPCMAYPIEDLEILI
ncbi:MAG: 2Fe-2S iron-sulfur cluster binding domain-containing protein [Deltaproteobacteria bacterium]|nr:2Fe-2S iron-sulfur cluster binding domain-containing protein [Deltaproteobacteria bacterium]